MTSPTAPVISATGISAPTFAQIYSYLQGQYYAIFGSDALITPDTQDGQLLAVFAQAISDANAACVAVYNSFSPATAQGTGLSSNVQINGLSRLVPSFSTAQAVISGTPNTPIVNGQAVDSSNNVWALPGLVTIGPGGTVAVTVTCATAGAITLGVNSLQINTPTFGWTGITNAAAAVGAPAETDAALRVRQAVSVALPSVTVFEGIVASIQQVQGVTRVKGYENNASSGLALPGGVVLPANNLDFVVEGGLAAAVAQAIFLKITPGIPTWNAAGAANNVSTVVADANGSTRLVNFQTALEAALTVAVTVHPLAGWAASTIALIKSAVAAYLNVLPIGGNIAYFSMIPVISLPNTPQAGTFEVVSLTLNGAGVDVQLAFSSAVSGALSPVTVTTI